MLLMTEIPNKVKLWQEACYQILEERPDIGYLLQDKAYLDSLERSQAIVGVKTWNLLEMLERKRVVSLLEQVFTEITGKPVQVKLTHGRPRIIERKPKPIPQQCSECGKSPSHCLCEYGPLAPKQAIPANSIPWANPELGALHTQYGDIMGIVDNHPVFVQAAKPITKGGWGVFSKELTNLCKDYGADIVLKGLRDVANKPRAERPRAYFFKNLKAGVYGHKLAIGASLIGPVRTSS